MFIHLMYRKFKTVKDRNIAYNLRRQENRRLEKGVEDLKVGRPRKYLTDEERKKARAESTKKCTDKRKAKEKEEALKNTSKTQSQRNDEYKRSIYNVLSKESFSYFVTLTYKPYEHHVILENYKLRMKKIDMFNQKHESEIEYNKFPIKSKSSYEASTDVETLISRFNTRIRIENYAYVVEKSKNGVTHIHLIFEFKKRNTQIDIIGKIIDKLWEKGTIDIQPILDENDKVNKIWYMLKLVHTLLDNKVNLYQDANFFMYSIGKTNQQKKRISIKRKRTKNKKKVKKQNSRFTASKLIKIGKKSYCIESKSINTNSPPPLSTHIGGVPPTILVKNTICQGGGQ